MLVLSKLFLYFFIYSIIGWIWETLLFTLTEKRFVYRGFLLGPLCPIYGICSVLSIIFLFDKTFDGITLFLVGFALCAILEFVTHWSLEKLFHARWWDYSDIPLNIQGRVCLPCSLAFGACIYFLITIIHPAVIDFTSHFSNNFIMIFSLSIYTILIIDISVTIFALIALKVELESLQKFIVAHIESSDKFTNRQTNPFRHLYSRIIQGFPDIKSIHYGDALEKIKKKLPIINRKNKEGGYNAQNRKNTK